MSEHWVGRLGGGGEKQNTESERNRVLKLRWDLMGYAAEGVVLVFFWETALVGRAIGPLLLVA
ncbi:MAG: hypothetical protein GY832_37495, partial [Chloroflexi bacterium]|nr:hypothetical protein [Chloroflexota bacterium]